MNCVRDSDLGLSTALGVVKHCDWLCVCIVHNGVECALNRDATRTFFSRSAVRHPMSELRGD
eukprot:5815534-Amphidinium_carterae.1